MPPTEPTGSAGASPSPAATAGDGHERGLPRRGLLLGGVAAAGAAVGATGGVVTERLTTAPPAPAPVPVTEELLTDHGLLKRVLLIYREASRRLRGDEPLDRMALYRAATVVHSYIENFHEGVEEGYVFPALIGAGRNVATVRTLLTQHGRGRKITTAVITATTPMAAMPGTGMPGLGTVAGRAAVAGMLDAFVVMYEHHEAWEDTEIFPAFRDVTAGPTFDRISEQIATEHENTIGERGITGYLEEVQRVEQQLGIGDLARFTPPDVPD